MKNNNNLTVKILLGVLAILLVLYFTLSGGGSERYQWTESYHATSDQPYGTLFIQKLLQTYRPGQNFILNNDKPLSTLLDTASLKEKTDYIFVGQDIYLEEADRAALLRFIRSGNDAFIASINLPFDLIDSVFVSECEQNIFLTKEETPSATLNFYNKQLKTIKGYKYTYRFGDGDMRYFWSTVSPSIFCDSTETVTPLGYIEPGNVNFLRLSYGAGNLYIHTNPLVFTNIFMARADKVEYASRVFTHLDGKAMIWDEFSKSKFIPKNNAPEVSPIAYILQQESLRYAWWLMLAGGILFTVFTAKRKQRVIPVLEEKSNTSLEFVRMISSLHFENGSHRDIARKKMKYFFYFIRAKYAIHAQALNEVVLKRLSEKSKFAPESLQEIANEFRLIDRELHYDPARLTTLYNALDNFYKNCK